MGSSEHFAWQPWDTRPGCYFDTPSGWRLSVRWLAAGRAWLWGVERTDGKYLSRAGTCGSADEARRLAERAYRRMGVTA